MTVLDIVRECGFNEVCLIDYGKEVRGVYIGDLLSWVMGNAEASCAWITIMSNVNTVAVATLVDVGCIIMAEGVMPDADTLEIAKAKGVNILSTSLTAYEAAIKLNGMGL